MYNILVVDDNKTNLQVLKQLLSGKYNVVPVLSAKMALHYVEKRKPDIILMDLLMPEIDGITAMKMIRELPNGKKVPIIFLTANSDQDTEGRCLKAGAADFITKPFIPEVMITRIEKALELEQLRETIQGKLVENARQLEETALQSFISIANAIDSRDVYRKNHMQRVAAYSIRLAHALHFSMEKVRTIEYSALVYDIGNIGIPDIIFMKQRKLTPKEQALMVGHPEAGAEHLKEITCIENIREVALYHHERYDGKGYPSGLSGEEIPVEARIISIVDAYVAMTSNRAYRESYPKEKACEEIKKAAGAQFDPTIADAFLKMLEEDETEDNIMEILVPQGFSDDSGLLMRQSNILLKRVLEEQNMVINSMASLDPLTELHNRKYLEMKLCTYLMEETHEGCFCIIDVDNFKYINDTYGHQTGDMALQKLAEIIKSNARETDVVCRLGGDEFVIFYEGLTKQSVIRKKAEKIMKEYHMVSCRNQVLLNTTLSIGVSITSTDGREYEELYKKADESLYYVKENGKNGIHFYNPEEVVEEDVKDTTSIAIDAHDIMELLDEKEYKRGAYKVTYSDFQRIYHFLSRCVERSKQNVQLLLLTVQQKKEGPENLCRLEKSVLTLEQGILGNLRRTDVSTRYSSCQYIVILLHTDYNDASKIIERILSFYNTNTTDHDYEVIYDVAQVHM